MSKDKVFKLRVTEEEMAILEKRATAAGVKASEYARSLLFGEVDKTLPGSPTALPSRPASVETYRSMEALPQVRETPVERHKRLASLAGTMIPVTPAAKGTKSVGQKDRCPKCGFFPRLCQCLV